MFKYCYFLDRNAIRNNPFVPNAESTQCWRLLGILRVVLTWPVLEGHPNHTKLGFTEALVP